MRRGRDSDLRPVRTGVRTHSGGGAAQYLTCSMGRAGVEVMLTPDDYEADLAERYGSVNRALPAAWLDAFVAHSPHPVLRFQLLDAAVKDRVDAIYVAPL